MICSRWAPAMLISLALIGCDPVPSTAPTATPSRTAASRATVSGAFNLAVTQATIDTTICVAGWTATVRPPASYTSRIERQKLAASGYTDQDPRHYELDHLVPLALGGAPRDERNLWPEPWPAARVKDKDEVRLQRAVCADKMTLAAAQIEILRLWGPSAR